LARFGPSSVSCRHVRQCGKQWPSGLYSAARKGPAAQLNAAGAVRFLPPLTEDPLPLAVLCSPPLTEEPTPLAVLRCPPLITAVGPLALLKAPP